MFSNQLSLNGICKVSFRNWMVAVLNLETILIKKKNWSYGFYLRKYSEYGIFNMFSNFSNLRLPITSYYDSNFFTLAPKYCQDYQGGCPTWKSSCKTSDYTKKFCLLTCNLCHVTPCEDERKDCQIYKQYCETYAVIKRGCFKTCGKCD